MRYRKHASLQVAPWHHRISLHRASGRDTAKTHNFGQNYWNFRFRKTVLESSRSRPHARGAGVSRKRKGMSSLVCALANLPGPGGGDKKHAARRQAGTTRPGQAGSRRMSVPLPEDRAQHVTRYWSLEGKQLRQGPGPELVTLTCWGKF